MRIGMHVVASHPVVRSHVINACMLLEVSDCRPAVSNGISSPSIVAYERIPETIYKLIVVVPEAFDVLPRNWIVADTFKILLMSAR